MLSLRVKSRKNMTEILLFVLLALLVVNIVIGLKRKVRVDVTPQMKELETSLVRFEATLERMEKAVRDEFQRNRTESSERAKNNREEQAASMKSFALSTVTTSLVSIK